VTKKENDMNTLRKVAPQVSLANSPRLYLQLIRLVLVAVVVGLVASTAQAQLYHKYIMRGQIVGATDDGVVLCIGSQDGAEVGQVLEVYKIVYEQPIEESGDSFRREHTGQVTIESIVDEHFARAKITRGEAEVHDVVELEAKK
jgi:hypothetical protein